MANKKKKKQRNRQRTAPAWTSSTPTAATESGPISSPVPAAPLAAPARPAAVGPANLSAGVSGPRRPAAGAPTGTIDIDARVPYFTSDLRRVLLTAGAMIVLIVAGSLLIK